MKMPAGQYGETYLEAMVYTASPEKLTLILYNHLVKSLLQAEQAIKEQNPAKSHSRILQAKKILLYLQNTLDKKYAIAHNLAALYEYMLQRLTRANTHKDAEILAEVLHLAREIRDTWSQAILISKLPNSGQDVI